RSGREEVAGGLLPGRMSHELHAPGEQLWIVVSDDGVGEPEIQFRNVDDVHLAAEVSCALADIGGDAGAPLYDHHAGAGWLRREPPVDREFAVLARHPHRLRRVHTASLPQKVRASVQAACASTPTARRTNTVTVLISRSRCTPAGGRLHP